MESWPGFDGFYIEPLQRALAGMPKAKGDMEVAIGNLASFALRSGRPRQTFFSLVTAEDFALTPIEIAKKLCAHVQTTAPRVRGDEPHDG